MRIAAFVAQRDASTQRGHGGGRVGTIAIQHVAKVPHNRTVWVTATAALARTATNIRSGGRSPIAAVTHALVVLLAMVALAPLLGLVPMSALAALLFVVAWNMSEARHFVRTLRSAPVAANR